MGATLAGVAYIWFAQAIAFLLMPRSISLALRVRALAFWAIAAVIVLMFQNPLTMLVTAAAILLLVAPLASLERAAFFLVAIPAVPVFITSPLPFPGINYLTDVTHYKLACLLLLVPVFLVRRNEKSPSVLSGAGTFVLLYAAYASLLITLSYGVTLGLRFGLDQIVLFVIPYFAILMVLQKNEDIESLFRAIVMAALLLAMIALVSRLLSWDIYGNAAAIFPEFRAGSLRINATAGTHSLAFNIAAGFMALEYLRHRNPIGWITLNLIRVVLVAGILTTASRGGMGGLLIAYAVYTLFMLQSGALRGALLFAAIVGSIGGMVWLTQGQVDTYDEFGTFSYRQELLYTSLDYIARYPFFGDRFFLQSGVFDHLIQGQGIVDVTNLYLQVALTFGLVGLVLFFGVFLFPQLATGRTLLGIKPALRKADSALDDWFRASAITTGVCFGWLFLVSTTSNVGLTPHIGMVFAAMCVALRKLRPLEQADNESVPNPSRSPISTPLKAPLASA